MSDGPGASQRRAGPFFMVGGLAFFGTAFPLSSEHPLFSIAGSPLPQVMRERGSESSAGEGSLARAMLTT